MYHKPENVMTKYRYHANPMWIPNAVQNPQSNSLNGPKKTKPNRYPRLDTRIKRSVIDIELGHRRDITYGNKTTMRSPKRRVSTDTNHKSNNCLVTTNTLSVI